MNSWLLNIGLALVLDVCLTGIVIPKILLIAFRKKLFDEPNERKIHTLEVPRLGGIAFKPVVFFTMALVIGVNLTFGNEEIISCFTKEVESLAYIFCVVMVLYLIGIGDDLVGIRYRAKFVAQIICSILLITGGLYIHSVYGLFGFNNLYDWFAYPLTVLLIVFIINSINLIDGIDGLASGLCSVVLMFYGITFYMIDQYVYALISFCVLGVLIPFYYYNVFGDAAKQKKIFMGDTGSLTIGVLICALSLKLSICAPAPTNNIPNPLVLAYSPLLIPCLDVIRVYLGRVRRGENPFLPDKTHIHHKLLALGMNQRKAMMTIIMLSIWVSLFNILLSAYINITLLLLIDVMVWTFINVWITSKIKINLNKNIV